MAACFGTNVGELLRSLGITATPNPDLLSQQAGSIDNGRENLDVLAAVSRNRAFVEELSRVAGGLIAKYGASRLRSPQPYYNRLSGKMQAYPPISSGSTLGTADMYRSIVQTLGILVLNRVIDTEYELKVSPIDPVTGEYCLPNSEDSKLEEALGLPTAGILQLSKRVNNVNRRGFTFTGVDLEVSAAFGNNIVDVKGMSGFSWSDHKDKNSDRRLTESQPTQHTDGARTIAGSIIFPMFDEDPIRSFIPMEFFHGNSPIADTNVIGNGTEMAPTEVPPFDLSLVLSNEYGAISAMVMYGVTITDSGGSIMMRQLENEYVIQYKALGYDSWRPVDGGTERNVNPFRSGFQSTVMLERRRRYIIMGEQLGGDGFESRYQSVMTDISKSFNDLK